MATSKITPPHQLQATMERLHQVGAVVFTNGVFDLIHPGHVQYLWSARQLGASLIVAVNTDESTRKIKGSDRPLIPLEQRVELLAAFSFVDIVTWFDEETPHRIIEIVRPDVLVKGGDWDVANIVGKDFVESYAGKVITIPFTSGYSTTKIVEQIVNLPSVSIDRDQ